MSYRMIVLDIDGTLTNDEKKITPKTKEALMNAQEQGAIIVLASGRPVAGLLRISKELELNQHHGLLLAYNGGKVIDAQTDQLIYEKAMPLERAKAILRHLKQFPVTPMVDDGNCLYVPDKNGHKVDYESSINDLTVKELPELAEQLDFSPVKVLTAAPNEVLMSVMKDITSPFEEEFSFIMSAPFYLECNMKGISKADSLGRVCESLHISPEEVISFGDAQNDLSMIEFAGHGVAMGNACEELKAAADEITLSNNEDGIAAVLERYF